MNFTGVLFKVFKCKKNLCKWTVLVFSNTHYFCHCSKYICLLGFIYHKLFICYSNVKMPKSFRSFTPWNSLIPPFPSLPYYSIAELRAPWDTYLPFTTCENSILVQKTGICRTASINLSYTYLYVHLCACLSLYISWYTLCLHKSYLNCYLFVLHCYLGSILAFYLKS